MDKIEIIVECAYSPIATYDEGIPTTSGDNTGIFEALWFDDASRVFPLPIFHPKLSILSRTPGFFPIRPTVQHTHTNKTESNRIEQYITEQNPWYYDYFYFS